MSKRWLAAKAIVYGLSLLTSATLLSSALGEVWAGAIVLAITAVRGGMDFFEHGLNTPVPTDAPAAAAPKLATPPPDSGKW